MTTAEKGNRNENEAKDIHKRVYGAGVEKVDAYTNHDPFGFVDLIAISPDKPVKFIQIKTNKFTAKAKRKYKQRLRHCPTDHAEFEVWVRIDRTGWDIYAPNEETNFEKIAEIHTCDTSQAREEYADFVEQGKLS